jgi:hypothetical protein
MNHRQSGRSTSVSGISRRGRLARAVTSAAVLAALLAACSSGSGGTPSTGGTSAGSPSPTSSPPSAVAYSACIRTHGVPNFPDPTGSGQIPKGDAQQLGVSTSRLEGARRSCELLIPITGSNQEQGQETQCATAGDCSQAVVQHWMAGLRTLAQCLRSHGEPNWPDPIIASQGTPHFNYSQAGIDHHAPQVLAKVDQCIRLTGFEGLPLP